ncbi:MULTISPECIES: hypothetical protein [Prevotellaceae]|uniref:hypothetical protein n=1 Tax=Prevotellaceae TaxID=171552 RepID=UPI0003D36170|nr:hypothetical protein [Prevotella phocaeensis]ETD21449.1 hypothetical protein HMPREF1199_00523 [Hoylesella oralis CC98A]
MNQTLLFKQRYTKTVGKNFKLKKNRAYRDAFGNMPVLTALAVFVKEQESLSNELKRLREKVNAFEAFLIEQNVRCIHSSKSESRYYYYNHVKYRFSSHIYPTGSMTNKVLGIVDLCADRHLIDEVDF